MRQFVEPKIDNAIRNQSIGRSRHALTAPTTIVAVHRANTTAKISHLIACHQSPTSLAIIKQLQSQNYRRDVAAKYALENLFFHIRSFTYLHQMQSFAHTFPLGGRSID